MKTYLLQWLVAGVLLIGVVQSHAWMTRCHTVLGARVCWRVYYLHIQTSQGMIPCEVNHVIYDRYDDGDRFVGLCR